MMNEFLHQDDNGTDESHCDGACTTTTISASYTIMADEGGWTTNYDDDKHSLGNI